MPMSMLRLKPGINAELTPSQVEAGYAVSNLIRFRNGLAEKLGGWAKYFQFAVGGIPKALHAWVDLNETEYLAVGTTTELAAISNGTLTDITPQTYTSNFAPKFTTTASSANITVDDSNIANVTTYDSVEFETPIAVGGIVLSGLYPIDLVLGTTTYRIVAADVAATSRAAATITGITAANPGSVTTSGAHGFSTGDLIYISAVVGMTQVNNRIFSITSTGANTFTIGVDTSAYTAYSSAGAASPSAVPFFTTTSGSASVTVTLQDHGLSAGDTFALPISTTLQSSVVTITNASPGVVTWFTGTHGMTGGERIVFTTTGSLPSGITAGTTYYVLAAGITTTTFRISATSGGTAINTASAGSGIHTGTVGSLTVSGTYTVLSVTDTDHFIIPISAAAQANSVDPMNSGNARIVYHIALGPTGASTGYSIGTYSSGGYSTGAAAPTQQTGTPITATDWTLDNFGEILLACPDGGGIYSWQPGGALTNAQLIAGAPAMNTGMFVATELQIVIAYGSTDQETIGLDQDPLLVQWSDQGDYTSWTASATSQAGSRRLSTGSKIVGGLAAPQMNLLFTDVGVWGMSYINFPLVFGFNPLGIGCGLIAKHAVVRQGSNVFWMSNRNFYVLAGGALQILNCTVWDVVFQDLNMAHADTCWAWSNTPFAEIWFFFPRESTSATQPDFFVKFNSTEGTWDYGPLDRTCGIDQSILGLPISATSTGIIYEHETSNNADGQAINAYLETGLYQLSEGNEVMFVDWVLPDMRFNDFGSSTEATLQITFTSYYYPGGPSETHGPYTFTNSTQYINTRIRGRLISIRIESNDLDSFWRLGGMRSRIAQDGRL